MRGRMLMVALASAVLSARAVPDAAPAPAPAAESRVPTSSAAAEFIAAMQRVRMNLPEPPDSAALKAYPDLCLSAGGTAAP